MRLGILVHDLNASQLAYFLIRNANALLAAGTDTDVTVFFEDPSPPCLPANFACMPAYECWGFTGTAVATTFETARKLQNCPGPRKRAFYVWDLEWHRPHARRTFDDWASVYREASLPLVARGPDHAAAISAAWNRPVLASVEDADLARLIGAVGG